MKPIATIPRRARQSRPLINRTIVLLLIFTMGFGSEFWRKDTDQAQITESGEILVASLWADHPSPPGQGFSENLIAALKRNQRSCDTQATIGAISPNKYRSDTVGLVLSRPGQSLQVPIRPAISPFSRDLRFHSDVASASA